MSLDPGPTGAGAWPRPPGDWFDAARALADGAPLGDALAEALHAELAGRARGAGAADWPPLRLSGLRVRHSGLPDWWAANGDLMLVGPDAAQVQIRAGLATVPGSRSLLVLGSGTRLHEVNMAEPGGVIAVGDDANLYAASLTVREASTILIGEQTTCTFAAHLDARNGGAIVVGADGMWGNGQRILTDDMHAIRDAASGRRLNGFGGRVVIGAHVWLGEQVCIIGDGRIGAGSVVGQGALVKGDLPPASLCVGRPAAPVRRGIVWTRQDEP